MVGGIAVAVRLVVGDRRGLGDAVGGGDPLLAGKVGGQLGTVVHGEIGVDYCSERRMPNRIDVSNKVAKAWSDHTEFSNIYELN